MYKTLAIGTKYNHFKKIEESKLKNCRDQIYISHEQKPFTPLEHFIGYVFIENK